MFGNLGKSTIHKLTRGVENIAHDPWRAAMHTGQRVIDAGRAVPGDVGMGRYEQMSNQFGDSKRAVNFLPKNLRSHLGQSPEDLGSKILTVTKAVEAGAAALQNPKAAPTKEPPAVSVNIPIIPIFATVVIIGLVIFLKRSK